MNQMNYSNENVVITGGSEGIGKAIAALFLKEGANVTILSRSESKIEKALAELREVKVSEQQRCNGYSLDVTDFDKTSKLYKEIAQNDGLTDILINTAGFAYPEYFENIPMEKFHDMMNVNYFGILNSVHAMLPQLKEKGGGRIVNTSSLVGFLPVFGYSGYAASKYAVIGFSEVLKAELKRFNIKVSVLCPPDTQTPGFEVENQTKPPETVEISKSAKLLTPEQVAIAFEKQFRKNKFMIIPGFDGKLSHVVRRLWPGLVDFVMDLSINKVQKHQNQG